MTDNIIAARTLRGELAPHWGRMGSFQWGKINAVNATTPPTVNLFLDGATAVTTGVYYLASYSPAVNDIVLVGRMQGPAQTARIVLGPLAQATPAAQPNLAQKLGSVALGAGTTTFTIPTPAVWQTVQLRFYNVLNASAATDNVLLRLNSDAGANYVTTTWDTLNAATTITVTNNSTIGGFAWTCIAPGTNLSTFPGGAVFDITGCNSGVVKNLTGLTRYGNATTNQMSYRAGVWNGSAGLTTLGFLSSTGPGTNSLSGTVEIWGYT